MHSTEIENILFAGACVCTFQPANRTSWGSEGLKAQAGCYFLPSETEM